MSGTVAGGRKAAQTNKRKYGESFYKVLGAQGGKKGKKDGAIKGFDADRELARRAGAIGGTISKRKKAGA